MSYWETDGTYIYNDEDLKTKESIVARNREVDALKREELKSIINSFPKTSEELIKRLNDADILNAQNIRLDLLKILVETYRNKTLDAISKYRHDFSHEASTIINSNITNYLCLIETLKLNGYNFGSTKDSYYDMRFDSQKPEMFIDELMTYMYTRRKNGANIEIPYPLNYNLDDLENTQKGDAVAILYCLSCHLENNLYMDLVWQKYGYKLPGEGQTIKI